MVTAVRATHPALRECLAGPMVAYDLQLPIDAVHVGLPSTAATVVLAVDDPLDVGWLHDPARSSHLWCSISGLHLAPALIRTHGVQRGIHMQVTPLGCRALFGAPLASLAGHTMDLSELPRGFSPAEHEAVTTCTTWSARLTAVEGLLLNRLRAAHLGADIVRAWQLLTAGNHVSRVADEVGWSRRHLANRVRSEFGVSPKQLGRLARFQHASHMVQSGMPLAEAAYMAGFADQAHLSREWKAFAGRSPGTSGEEFPNLQDLFPALTPD